MNIVNPILIISLIISTLVGQQSFEDFKRQQEKAFDDFKASVNDEYVLFRSNEEADFKRFKEDVERQWQEFKGSTAKVYVSYDDDLASRASIDYDAGEVIVEVIMDDEDLDSGLMDDREGMTSDRLAYNGHYPSGGSMFLLNSFLAPLIPQTADHVYNELSQNKADPVLQKLADTRLFKKLVKFLSEKDDSGDLILEDQISDSNGGLVKTNDDMKEFAVEKVKNTTKGMKEYLGRDGKKRKSFSLKFSLRSDHKNVRSNKYGKQILKQSKRFDIDPAIAMAVTETESSFNPKATSHIPAYGLMQLVPSSGARDAYQYVYGKDKFLGKRYLYKPNNNIELGCAYLGKIRHQYFKGVRDDEKAFMCTVAAYNTGAGNVSRALTNTTKLSPAIKRVNNMSSIELYKTLLRDLEHEETRNYLKKVWERKEKYRS